MHESEPYGYLFPGRRRVTAETEAASNRAVTRDNGNLSRDSHADVTRDSFREVSAMEIDASTGTGPSSDRIARMCGVSLSEYSEVLAELDAAGVPRYTVSGIMFDEEMVDAANERKQWKLRQDRHRGIGGKNEGSHEEIMGALGGSHANVTRDNGRLSRGSHADVTHVSRARHGDVTPSSSSSSSSKIKNKSPLPPATSAGGNFAVWQGSTPEGDLFVDMGRARRLLTDGEKEKLHGGQPEDYAQFFRRKGYRVESRAKLETALGRDLVSSADVSAAIAALDAVQAVSGE